MKTRRHILTVSWLLSLASLSTLTAQTIFVPGGTVGTSANGNVGIGATSPLTTLQVVGPTTAGERTSTNGVDYLYGWYSYGKLFVIGSKYSSGASFLGFGIKATPNAAGYLSSTSIAAGRSAFEANAGYLAFLTGGSQTSTDGGAVTIAERVRIDQNGYVGIGTTSPAFQLEVCNSQNAATYIQANNPDGLSINAQAGLRAVADTAATYVLAHGSGRTVARYGITLAGYSEILVNAGNGLVCGTSIAKPLIFGTNGGERMRIDSTGNVGIGTTSPTYPLTVNGTVRAKEVIVDTGWSDYVFDDSYQLKALSEVEAYVKAEKHLPGIPTTQEVKTEGISVGDMQARLLAKIEELTLHVIQQEKRLQKLEQENEALRKRLSL